MGKFLCTLILLILVFETVAEAKIVKTNNPYSYDMLERDLKNIQKKYKRQIEAKSIGTTHFGKPDAVGGGFTDWFITTYHKRQ